MKQRYPADFKWTAKVGLPHSIFQAFEKVFYITPLQLIDFQ